MGDKFREIVNAPHRAFGRATELIMNLKPKDWRGRSLQVAGAATSLMAQFLLWATKYVALDNHALRAGERALENMSVPKNPKTGKDRRVPKFMKKYPNLSSHIMYYMLLASLWGGGRVADGIKDKDAIWNKKELLLDQTQGLKICPTSDYAEFVAQCQPLNPFLIGFLSCPEGFRSAPYRDSRNIPTRGYGSTMTASGPITMLSPAVTKSHAYEDARWHIEDYETTFLLYCYCVAFDKTLNANEYIGLMSFLYNGGADMFEPDTNARANRIRNDRWTLLRNIFRENGNITREQVQQHFEKYPIQSEGSVCYAWRTGAPAEEVGNNMTRYLKGGRGLQWRRWIEACIFAGYINPVDMFDCPVGGVYDFQEYMKNVHNVELIDRDARTVNYKAASEFMNWIKHPQYWDKRHKRLYDAPANQATIESILPENILGRDTDKGLDGHETAAEYTRAADNVKHKSVLRDQARRLFVRSGVEIK